jgi:hypothetical protein
MLEIDIKREWIEEAERKSKEMGQLRNSITKGKGNVVGFLGEIVAANHIKATIENTHDYDIIKNNVKIDVKTKKCSSKPKDFYECSISEYNTKQKCDLYLFIRILNDNSKAWLCGMIGKNDFFKNAKFYPKGFVDKSNNMKFHCDTYNMQIKDLVPFKKTTS